MKIKLEKLTLKGFKKFKLFEIVFNLVTSIFGANRAGKTTVLDAFMWVLFGVDSNNKTDFDIKTRDKRGGVKEKVDVSVVARINVDGKSFNIGRTLKEVWAPIKNSNETFLQKHRTVYMWNDIDISQSEFFGKRDALIDKNIFKLLTSVTYFTSLTPEVQRNMLMSLIPNIDDSSILNNIENKTDFLLKIINENENFDNAKKSLTNKIAIIKKELKEIQPRIDQSETLKPKDQAWEVLSLDLKKFNSDLEKIKELLTDKSKVLVKFNEDRIKEQENLNNRLIKLNEQKNLLLKGGINKKNKIDIELTKLDNDKKVLAEKMKVLNEELINNSNKIDRNTELRTELLGEYNVLNKSTFVFNSSDGNCENCGKVLDNLDEIKIDALQKFETKRTKKLNEIKIKGAPLTEKIAELKDRSKIIETVLPEIRIDINSFDEKIKEATENLAELEKVDPLENEAYQEAKAYYMTEKYAFENAQKPTVDNVKLLTERATINQKIDNLKALIATKKTIENIDIEIEKLQLKEQSQVAEIMTLEADLYSLDSFNKLKVERMEGEVNKLFSFAKFKMFEHQINGIDKPICKASFRGVTFNSLNNEAKINVGLDIINVFSKHHNISAPVFIDNRESVTEIIPIDTQIVNLIVDQKAEELVIN